MTLPKTRLSRKNHSATSNLRRQVFRTVDVELSYGPSHTNQSEEPAIPTFVTPLLIYVLTPIVGLSAYLVLLKRMRSANVISPPDVPFFILFFTLGGCLTVLLTAWFWEWSGLASLGVLYLIFIAPALTAWLAWRLRVQRALSKFHACAFYICVAYTCLIVIGVPWAYVKTRPWHP